jgi:hypothetical protein
MFLRYIDAVVAGHTSDVVLDTTAAVAEHHLLLLLKTAIISAGHSCVEHSCCCYWTAAVVVDTGDVISGYYYCCWVCMRYTAAIVELIFMTLFHVKVMLINTSTWTSLMKASDRIRTRKKYLVNKLTFANPPFLSIAVHACLFHIKKTEPSHSQK